MQSKAVKTSGTRALQREQTRRQLIDAGLRVVASAGFAGATTAAIAQATGKAHGTVFVHFRNREALVTELVNAVGQAISTRLAALADAAPGLPEVLDAHLTALGDNEVLYSRLLCAAPTLPLSARAQVFALQSGIAWRIRTAYLQAREQGSVRDIDPLTLSNIWISLTNHYLINRDLFAPDASVIARCGGEIKTQLLTLLQA